MGKEQEAVTGGEESVLAPMDNNPLATLLASVTDANQARGLLANLFDLDASEKGGVGEILRALGKGDASLEAGAALGAVAEQLGAKLNLSKDQALEAVLLLVQQMLAGGESSKKRTARKRAKSAKAATSGTPKKKTTAQKKAKSAGAPKKTSSASKTAESTNAKKKASSTRKKAATASKPKKNTVRKSATTRKKAS